MSEESTEILTAYPLLLPLITGERPLYRSATTAVKAVLALASEHAPAGQCRRYLTGSLEDEPSEAVVTACTTAIKYLSRKSESGKIDRVVVATATSAARASLRAYRAGGDPALIAHHKLAARLESQGKAHEAALRDLQEQSPFYCPRL